MAQLGHITDAIHQAGARLVVVGNGTPAMAARFAAEKPLDASLYVDPSLKVYEAAGLKRGVGATFNPASVMAGIRALRKGHFQTSTQGDPWQQGGTFVVWPGGEVNYRHVSGFAGDHAPEGQVFKALRNPPRREKP